jgi:hypothetical protein
MSTTEGVQKLISAFRGLSDEAERHRKDWSEEDLRASIARYGILEALGYTSENYRFEKTGPRGRGRTDIECYDDYGATVLIIECKKPSDSTPLIEYLDKVWREYVLPLKASYALLTN